jgi:CheY-like chemotaxis protein
MDGETGTAGTVLIVDDEKEVADVYALRLGDRFETVTAYGGEEALDHLDEDVDAVLLDRRMPVMSGDDVLREIRDRGFDIPVVMITAVDPDLNILDLPFDDYLCKPVDKGTLVQVLEQQLASSETSTDERLSEFYQVASKLMVLDVETPQHELEDSEEYQRLKERTESLREELAEEIDGFDEIAETFFETNRTTARR